MDSANNSTFVALHYSMGADIKFIVNKSEITAGTRGASLGPEAIMVAARKQNTDFFHQFELIEILDENRLLDQVTVYPFAKRIDGLIKIFDRLCEQVKRNLNEGDFPFVIAADHGSAGGTVAGIAAANPSARLGIVWIDAHADIHSPYTTPSGNLHGMPLSTILNVDNKACQINDLDNDTLTSWERLKNTGIKGAKINPSDLVYIAVRDTEPQEDHIMKELRLRNYEVSEVRASGVEQTVKNVLNQLSDCDLIYVSFDVDSMDPDLTSYGTGTPVKNGLSPEEAAGILEGLVSDRRTCCVEFVEVNPCLDEKKNKMAEVAFDLIKRTTEAIKNRD
jgi:arginase